MAGRKEKGGRSRRPLVLGRFRVQDLGAIMRYRKRPRTPRLDSLRSGCPLILGYCSPCLAPPTCFRSGACMRICDKRAATRVQAPRVPPEGRLSFLPPGLGAKPLATKCPPLRRKVLPDEPGTGAPPSRHQSDRSGNGRGRARRRMRSQDRLTGAESAQAEQGQLLPLGLL